MCIPEGTILLNNFDLTFFGSVMPGGSGFTVILHEIGHALGLKHAKDDGIFGESGNDQIYGRTGNDILYGDKGNDVMWGGNGADIFVFNINSGVVTPMGSKLIK